MTSTVIALFQVLSRSVAAALAMTGREEYDSTVELVERINDVFDILNISNRAQGTQARNKFKMSLESVDDWRFQVSELHFSVSICQQFILLLT